MLIPQLWGQPQGEGPCPRSTLVPQTSPPCPVGSVLAGKCFSASRVALCSGCYWKPGLSGCFLFSLGTSKGKKGVVAGDPPVLRPSLCPCSQLLALAGGPWSQRCLLRVGGVLQVPPGAGVCCPGPASPTSWLTPAPPRPTDVARWPPVSPHHYWPGSPHQR